MLIPRDRLAMEARNKLFLGSFVHSKKLKELESLHNAAVAVDGSGKIVAVEPDCSEDRARETVLPRLGWRENEVEFARAVDGQFFFPGFIDTHIHASQYPNVGIFGDSSLLEWLKKYTFPLEESLKDPARARQVYTRVIRKTLSHGTTCAAYYATINVPSTNLLADLCHIAGQRALVGRVCMNQNSPDDYKDASVESAIADTRASIEHIRSIDPAMTLVRPIITPRFAPACTVDLMRQLGELAKETGLPIQTHISENTAEIALVRDLFPPSVTGAADDTYAAVYDAFGLLTERTILGHAVYLTDSEAELVARRKAKISHCPCSNSALTSGNAHVRRQFLDRGIACGLGTDMSGGYSPSVLEAARQAALVSRAVVLSGNGEGKRDDGAALSVDEVLYLATRGGAEVVGLADKVGAFEVGMEWDAQLIGLSMVGEDGEVKGGDNEGGDVDIFGWEEWPNRVAKWVYNGDDRNTKKVWVKGRLVHERK